MLKHAHRHHSTRPPAAAVPQEAAAAQCCTLLAVSFLYAYLWLVRSARGLGLGARGLAGSVLQGQGKQQGR